jgi:hypothetical protein
MMVTRRKSALVAVAVTAICALWAGLLPSPASASAGSGTRAALDGDVGDSVELISTTASASAVAAPYVCGKHEWNYRIYVVGTNQTLFRWAFSTDYCYIPNSYWFVFTPTSRVALRHSSIRGDIVEGKIYAHNGINGSLMTEYAGATFEYCPNACVKTFRPTLRWAYALSGSRIYLGDVPLR